MKKTLIVLAALAAISCAPKSTEPPAVAAEGSGIRILRSELDAKAAGRLLALSVQENEARRAALNEMLYEALLKKEADARHITTDQLLHVETQFDETPPSPEELEALYRENIASLRNRTEKEAKEEIIAAVLRQRSEVARSNFAKSLVKKWNVHIHLPPPRVDVKVPEGAPALGPASAPVTLVEFADYQCPFCQRAEARVETILEKNPKTVRFVLLDFPLEMHSQAMPAAEAAHCAGDQGKFFEYRHSLLSVPGPFDEEDLLHRADSLKLNVSTFKECVDSKRHEPVIKTTFDEARGLGVSATPTFFVNGRILEGFSDEGLQELIDSELSGD